MGGVDSSKQLRRTMRSDWTLALSNFLFFLSAAMLVASGFVIALIR
jgi:hypothetical protein